jgi:hypothetical protein
MKWLYLVVGVALLTGSLYLAGTVVMVTSIIGSVVIGMLTGAGTIFVHLFLKEVDK